MNKLLLAVIAVVFSYGSLSCEQPPDIIAITNLNAKQGYQLIEDNKNNPDFVILDVRTPEEYNSGHIENAVNIDYSAENFKDEVGKLEKNKTYALYCGSGRRAVASSEIMGELGFKNIYEFGGVKQWTEAGFSLTPAEGQ